MDTKPHMSAWHIVHLCIGPAGQQCWLWRKACSAYYPANTNGEDKTDLLQPSLHHALITYMYMSLISSIGHDVAISSIHVRHLTLSLCI